MTDTLHTTPYVSDVVRVLQLTPDKPAPVVELASRQWSPVAVSPVLVPHFDGDQEQAGMLLAPVEYLTEKTMCRDLAEALDSCRPTARVFAAPIGMPALLFHVELVDGVFVPSGLVEDGRLKLLPFNMTVAAMAVDLAGRALTPNPRADESERS